MGCEPCFCCFARQSPNCMAWTGIIASILSIAFLIWGLADLSYDRKGAEVIYIIAFVLIVLCLIGFIIISILLNLRQGPGYSSINNFGRILCLVILGLCFISFVFLLAHWLVEVVDYADVEKLLPGRQISRHDWAAVFVPSFISFISLVFMALAANILYKVFLERLMQNTVHSVNQNSITTIPNNSTQPGIIPNNNAQPVPPMVANNVSYPVTIQQSGTNLNK